MAASNIHNSHAATRRSLSLSLSAPSCSLSILRGNSHVVAAVSPNKVSVLRVNYSVASVYVAAEPL